MPDKDPNLAALAEPEGLELDWTDEAGRVNAGRDLILAPEERALLEALRANFGTPAGAPWEAEVSSAALMRLGRLRARLIARIGSVAQADGDVGGVTTLEALRATIREDLLTYGDLLATDDYDYGQVKCLRDLVAAYRGLGGDLELVPQRAGELDRALAALNEASHDLALEDFPERLQPFARAANAVLEAAR